MQVTDEDEIEINMDEYLQIAVKTGNTPLCTRHL